mmetsp:Transcript_10460/g.23113  ORF Transcript_10460/g.23113 Transcript_10460/m.23113 type:complete len:210 (+) Transcript_10460:504-1133(+)
MCPARRDTLQSRRFATYDRRGIILHPELVRINFCVSQLVDQVERLFHQNTFHVRYTVSFPGLTAKRIIEDVSQGVSSLLLFPGYAALEQRTAAGFPSVSQNPHQIRIVHRAVRVLVEEVGDHVGGKLHTHVVKSLRSRDEDAKGARHLGEPQGLHLTVFFCGNLATAGVVHREDLERARNHEFRIRVGRFRFRVGADRLTIVDAARRKT